MIQLTSSQFSFILFMFAKIVDIYGCMLYCYNLQANVKGNMVPWVSMNLSHLVHGEKVTVQITRPMPTGGNTHVFGTFCQ